MTSSNITRAVVLLTVLSACLGPSLTYDPEERLADAFYQDRRAYINTELTKDTLLNVLRSHGLGQRHLGLESSKGYQTRDAGFLVKTDEDQARRAYVPSELTEDTLLNVLRSHELGQRHLELESPEGDQKRDAVNVIMIIPADSLEESPPLPFLPDPVIYRNDDFLLNLHKYWPRI